ncbi:hypothetical protein AB6A40_004162 [Gnathostoma spinigerum]|uniref:ZP domain-containing protein n=1 Tax=Gnathostoma spinigerum TaxID=75299 RepID=A0ABD6EBP0_9BILA
MQTFVMVHCRSLVVFICSTFCFVTASVFDNGVIGIPQVDCMENHVRLTFNTERPLTGRIFVKGMVDNDQCVKRFDGNMEKTVFFEMDNGKCNMRRSRKVSHSRIIIFLDNLKTLLIYHHYNQ